MNHRENLSWATSHLAQMSAGQLEKEGSPTPSTTNTVGSATPAPTTPVLPTPLSMDPDAPLNLSKPKSSSSSPSGDSPVNITQSSIGQHQVQPLAATAPKLFPPGMTMPGNFLPSLPYAGLPPHFNSLSSPS